MTRPLWLNRALGRKPGWTDQPQRQSIYRWANIEPPARIRRARHTLLLLEVIFIGGAVMAATALAIYQLGEFAVWAFA